MKKIIYILSGLTLAYAMSSCKQNEFKTHEKGFSYQFIVENSDSSKPKVNEVIELYMDYYFNGDSLIYSSSELGQPIRMKLKRAEPNGETIDDALALMHIGDSAHFRVNANIFYTVTKHTDVPQFVNQTDFLEFRIRLVRAIDVEQYTKEHEEKPVLTKEAETERLDRFLKMTNIESKPSSSGVYITETQKGQGAKAQKGDTVSVHYMGAFVDGKSFSNTYDSGRPFTFILGKDELIAGFEESIYTMQKGGRYTVVIPSEMAYGEKGNEIIPANTTLVFEIDLLDIR